MMLPKMDVPSGFLCKYMCRDAAKICEVLYSLLVGGRNMFSLNPYIVAQIAAFHGCEHPASVDDHTDNCSQLLFHFLSGSCVLHRCSSSGMRACRTFAVASAVSRTDMVGYILDALLNSVLSTENLLNCVFIGSHAGSWIRRRIDRTYFLAPYFFSFESVIFLLIHCSVFSYDLTTRFI